MKEADKALFVTGGASGIGKTLAELYIKKGYSVALFDLNPGRKEVLELRSLCGNKAQKIAGYRVDVKRASEVKKAVNRAVIEIGIPSRAINCAGIQRAFVFEELNDKDYRSVIETNLFGSLNFAAAVLPHMKDGAKLAFISSLAGIVTNYTYAAYSSSKFGVVGLAGVLRIELKLRGIGVSVICPPEIITPMVEKELITMHHVTRKLKDFAGTIPLEKACISIYRDLERGKFLIIPGFKAKLTYLLNKLLPVFIKNSITDRIVKKALKEMQQRG